MIFYTKQTVKYANGSSSYLLITNLDSKTTYRTHLREWIRTHNDSDFIEVPTSCVKKIFGYLPSGHFYFDWPK